MTVQGYKIGPGALLYARAQHPVWVILLGASASLESQGAQAVLFILFICMSCRPLRPYSA